MKEYISPPPLKRQRLTQPVDKAEIPTTDFTPISPPTPGALRIFSWNINGIEPFVQPYLQKSIKSFFKPATNTVKRKRPRDTGSVTSDGENDEAGGWSKGDREDPAKEGPASLRLVLGRYGWPQIFCLQEVKVKPGDSKTMEAIRQAVNDPIGSNYEPVQSGKSTTASLSDGGPEYKVEFNLPADPYNAKGFGGKVYGVATIVRRDFMAEAVQEIREVPWDREGRIQIIETKELSLPLGLLSEPLPTCADSDDDKEAEELAKSKFAIINIYAVNGTTNPYRSTHTGEQVGTRHDRKLAVHSEILIEAKTLEAKGFHVIIAGDLNVACTKLDGHPKLRTTPYQHVLNRRDFVQKFFLGQDLDMAPSKAAYNGYEKRLSQAGDIQSFSGVDTFRNRHIFKQRFSYHPRGVPWGSTCDRVDLIITSQSLEDNILDSGIYDSPRDRGPSDHCPIWVEIGSRMKSRRDTSEV
ncbi:hypothetical protein PFICI_00915 [Pestalotiopsis fici W106-1]|uniref:Endonuclease/exonuclease/phosphatase domain-containing protein n=1 Tax=Pestalotiopsis fici (strain W106-1 / CGMCC3.15140) TaxID=1229662 RepID=W3XNJ7_PESFW|nr:uncharacterized protein PFICI_00915 [Pestalotiopsis fici W106-1]ETS87087.1 hypothetical protein PFICI_00915 [Pestalotiopsis fici W106-1]